MRFLTLVVLGGSLCFAATPSPEKSETYARSIQQLGGTVANPSAFPETIAGFQQYLLASGVRVLSAVEMTHPNHPEIAARLGFSNFLPAREWWPRGASLALLTQSMQAATQVTARLRNWWRPAAYNQDPAVGGAKGGDHPTANAFDLDFNSVADRMKAESFFRGVQQRFSWMNLSFGFGAQTTHIGLGSPRGHREWHYAGWRPVLAKLAVPAVLLPR
jgi:hypothetical protein